MNHKLWCFYKVLLVHTIFCCRLGASEASMSVSLQVMGPMEARELGFLESRANNASASNVSVAVASSDAAQLLKYLEAEDSQNSSLAGKSPSSSHASHEQGSLRSLGCNSPQLASHALLPSFDQSLASGAISPAVQQPLLSAAHAGLQDGDFGEGSSQSVPTPSRSPSQLNAEWTLSHQETYSQLTKDMLASSAASVNKQAEQERVGWMRRFCRRYPKTVKTVAGVLVVAGIVYGAYRVYLACV